MSRRRAGSLRAAGAAALALLVLGAAPATRTIDFSYVVTADVPAGEGPIDLFVPIARGDDGQEIVRSEVVATVPGTERTEERHGNRFWHARVERSDGTPIRVQVDYTVKRTTVRRDVTGRATTRDYSRRERKEASIHLAPDRRTPVKAAYLEPMLADLRARGARSPYERARATYDFVVDTMEYKKTGTGWGNGDTEWACSQRYGNCTDFHALFLSLARAQGLPSRFEIGFPVPEDRVESEIPGYHCWVEVYLPEVGWFPIDASEAKKRPEKRDLFFGAQPPDRVLFTVGRDLELGPGHTTGPLNYFVYPHVEVGGKVWTGVTTRFRFVDRTARGETPTAGKTTL